MFRIDTDYILSTVRKSGADNEAVRKAINAMQEAVRDRNTRNRVERRLKRLEDGNFGDCQSVGEGVFELRLHFEPGYRIYFG